jgi:hypothetical protein
VQVVQVDVNERLEASGLDQVWLGHLHLALGEQAPTIPTEAWAYLPVWLRWIVPPQRVHMALATAGAFGVHAQRYGWAAVARFLDDEEGVERPHYVVFAWLLRRLVAGANGVDPASIDAPEVVRHTQVALGHLFSGSDLFALGTHAGAWRSFMKRGGLATGMCSPPPILLQCVDLVGGEVVARQLHSADQVRAIGRDDLWPMIESDQAIAFTLTLDQPLEPALTLVLRPNPNSTWHLEPSERRIAPELQMAALELSEVLNRMDLPTDVRQRYQEAAIRRNRYSPESPLWQCLDSATGEELELVGCWFPRRGDEDAIQRLRWAWQRAGP